MVLNVATMSLEEIAATLVSQGAVCLYRMIPIPAASCFLFPFDLPLLTIGIVM